MLNAIGFNTLDELMDSTVPSAIRLPRELVLESGEQGLCEQEALAKIKGFMGKNKVLKSFIGAGYHDTVVPEVIKRNILEHPGWYTAYTPYQAEISQGRLQMLLNFQTMVCDLTGMQVCNASLLDEATAAAEAMQMCLGSVKKRPSVFISERCHPQTIDLVLTRMAPLGVTVVVGDANDVDVGSGEFAGAMVQYPDTYGGVKDWRAFTDKAHDAGTMVVACCDLLAGTMLTPPGEWGADIAVGCAQRFGVPMGFGGPHAGFLACASSHQRKMPGRMIGVSIDSQGDPALRMALQTREQHIRRDKATSNICTAQALLANMAAAYGVYHGPGGLADIAGRVHKFARLLAAGFEAAGHTVLNADGFFDTLEVEVGDSAAVVAACAARGVNVRPIDVSRVGVSVGESVDRADVEALLAAFGAADADADALGAAAAAGTSVPAFAVRESPFMTHPVFNTHHSETQMLRYLKSLEAKDLSLNHSMISLGSCTMKLNATAEMVPVTWPEVGNIHPFVPADQCEGYLEMIESLHRDLCEITQFDAISSQPNSGANGEYAGLLAIRQYHHSRGDANRNVCLIPVSAHGTNPASAAMAGMKVVVVKSDDQGNVDIDDLKAKAEKHSDNLAALMITYPSTYGVFEEGVVDIIDAVHGHGGQVYMDGANMNAQCGWTAPGFIGADVCHLNLHKTFCIPHGGGGPGVGSIGVKAHLAPFLPGHTVVPTGGEGINTVPKATGSIAAAPWGSAAILPITWMYIQMMGGQGLKDATATAVLNANYMAKRIGEHYPILFTGTNGQCAHEFIMDIRPFKEHGFVEEDIAKRLQDYGFHSPTMSWPVTGTLMVEPTESEDKGELDRFCDAMISIRHEMDDVIEGRIAVEDSPLKHAPHTAGMVLSDSWNQAYTREQAAFPTKNLGAYKFWPTVGRIDNVYGDRNLICTCPPMESYMEEEVDTSA